MSKNQDWSEYFEFTRNKPPYSFLINAIKYVKDKGKALDIGGGALRDTKYLLKEGFQVTVIDSSPLLEKEAKRINSAELQTVTMPFEEYNFRQNKYDLVSAMFALNFCNPAQFDDAFKKIKSSLKPNGILCVQMFGDRDPWANNPKMTYPNKDHIMNLLSTFEIISFHEKFTEDKDSNDEIRSGHVFQFIARK